MIWRDTWDSAPGVVIVSEQAVQDGELDAVLLALRLPALPRTLSVSNERGETLTLLAPANIEPFSINVRVTLKPVEA